MIEKANRFRRRLWIRASRKLKGNQKLDGTNNQQGNVTTSGLNTYVCEQFQEEMKRDAFRWIILRVVLE